MNYYESINCKTAADLLKAEGLKPILSGMTKKDEGTGNDGILRVKVPRYHQNTKDPVYLIIENGLSDQVDFTVDVEKRMRPLPIMFPVLDPKTQTPLDVIHIYPKNVGYLRAPYFFKLGKQKDGSEVPLAGVVFACYRYDEEGNKFYLDSRDAADLKNHWITSKEPLTDKNVRKFTSDKKGLVTLENRFLPSGNYYFEELQTIEDYVINAEQTKIEVIIPENWRDTAGNPVQLTINGEKMLETASGEIPDSAYQSQSPRVYNYQKKSPTPGKDPPIVPGKPGWLPQMGEGQKMLLTIIGCLLILVVFGNRIITRLSNSGSK